MTAATSAPEVLAAQIADMVCALPPAGSRHLIAIAGPPGAGKSTVAQLAQDEIEQRGTPCGLVPMDGFHYDNVILIQRDLLARKGAPETFDVAGFHAMLVRLSSEDEVAVPEFDRDLDKAIAARALVQPEQRVVLIEGNYLLLDEPGWSELQPLWSATVFLSVAMRTLEERLTNRWLDHGLSPDAAKTRAQANDIPNAERINRNSRPSDLVLT